MRLQTEAPVPEPCMTTRLVSRLSVIIITLHQLNKLEDSDLFLMEIKDPEDHIFVA